MRAPKGQLGPWTIDVDAGWLGRGGYGTVYRGTDSNGRTAAVKMFNACYSHRHETPRVHGAEVGAHSAVSEHPNVPTLYGHGVDDGWHWLAMELVEGDTLVDRLDPMNGHTFCEGLAERVFLDVCSAVQACHDAGFLHSDVKPSNIIIRPDGSAVLLDFGLATPSSLDRPDRLGTPGFVAPERLDDYPEAPIDERADVYALGCLLYALHAGASPFTGDTPVRTLRRQLRGEHAELVGPHGPTIGRAIARNPAERYRTVGALVHAFTTPQLALGL